MALPLSLRLARRELRGGLKGFRVFLMCLSLGVAAIAAVGSLSEALIAGLTADARKLLAGDVELRLTHREATPEQIAWLTERGRLSLTVEMRAMAQAPEGGRSLVELKAVDGAYPLYGAVRLTGGGPVDAALARRDGLWGAVAEPALLRRLDLEPGDRLKVGDATFEVRGGIKAEPDRGTDGFELGPRLMVALDAMAETGLVVTGSIVRHHYRLALPPGTAVGPVVDQIEAAFPDAAWRVRDVRNGAPGLRRFVERMRLFLTLVGLTALVVGGLGVANAVKAYLETRTATIATLKCLGAPAGLVFRIYLAEVAALALVGIAIGLAVGAVAPTLAAGLLAQYLPFEARGGVYPLPLLLALAYGLLTALAFALWPLARAREVPAAALFRSGVAPGLRLPPARYVAATAGLFALLSGLAVLAAQDRLIALWFVGGTIAAFLAFLGAARLVVRGAARLPRPRRPGLRLALANLHRPGAPTVSVLLSFGLGLTVLVAVAGIEGNLTRQVADRLPERAPSYFFVDIQPDQIEGFRETALAVPGVSEVESVPSLRGRIVRIGDRPADAVEVDPDVQWVLRGDRGLTYQTEPPVEDPVVAGTWWPADHAGPQLVSVDADVARGLGLAIGDSLTVNVLGRELTAEVASLRRVDWSSLGINFVLKFSPGPLSAAPHTFIATARTTAAAEAPLDAAIAARFPNVTVIRVKDALETVNSVLANIGLAVRAIAAVTLVAGIMVLAGAVAAGHRRRVYDAVVLKVLGATRAVVLRAFLIEYALLGAVAAAIALVVGTAAAWGVVTEVMAAEWVWLPGSMAAVTLLSLAVTVGFGLVGTLAALGQKPAPYLRND